MMARDNFLALLDAYDAFLLDQFGTLHDGTQLYPGVLAALEAARAAGRRCVLLSNSGKRAAANAGRLARLGIRAELIAGYVTSGEVAWALLAAGEVDVARGARRCLLIERDGDGSFLDGLDLRAVPAAEAELVLIAGSEGERRSLDSYRQELAPLARAGIPALCINPDRVMLTPRGLAFGAACIAEAYAEAGGAVSWIGKPYPQIFAAGLRLLGDMAPHRVACVGDSVEHDIAGARAAGLAGWLVRTGIVDGFDDAALAAEYHCYDAVPDGVLERFG